MLKYITLVTFFVSNFALGQVTTLRKIKTIIVDAGHGGNDPGACGGQDGGLGTCEKNVTLTVALKLVKVLRDSLPEVKIVPTRTTDIYQSPSLKADIANQNKGDLFICIHADAADLKRATRTVNKSFNEIYYEMEHPDGDTTLPKEKVKKTRVINKMVTETYKVGTKRSGTSVWLFAPHKTSEKMNAIMKSEKNYSIESSYDTAFNKIDFSTPEKKVIALVWAKRYQEKSYKAADLVLKSIVKKGRPSLGISQRQKGIWVLQATNMPAILIETGFMTNNEDERYLNSEKGQNELVSAIATAIKKYKYDVENHNTNGNVPIVKPEVIMPPKSVTETPKN